jgi:aerobic C4-dicarboxylate transport protein
MRKVCVGSRLEQAGVGLLKAFATSPMALLACLLGGGVAGWLAPSVGVPAFVLGQVYLALVNLVAIPLMVVATFFGLRQTLALPQPARRGLMILAFATVLVFFCAGIGALYGMVTSPGQNLTTAERAYLGSVVQGTGGDAGNSDLNLFETDVAPSRTASHPWAAIVPDNLFRALAQGQSLAIMTCAIFFGLAFASMTKKQNGALMGVFEAAYRSFELIMSKANMFIPVLAFGIAAHFAANTNVQILHAMSSFLSAFLCLTLLLAVLGVYMIWKNSDNALTVVLKSLKTPVLISLTSGSSAASIPDTIRAMSVKLGFSRGIVELVVPAASIFVRAGAAVYFALLAVFVSNIYGHALAGSDFLVICLGSVMAAFVSAGRNSAAVVGAGSIVLSMLNLPIEAALALFLALDLICEGPRNLISLLCCCVLIVLVCRGLPSERLESKALDEEPERRPVQFSFSKKSALAAVVCLAVLACLVTVAGVGVGQKLAADRAIGNVPIFSERMVVDNPANTR